jgi:hypothetical protein
MALSTNTQSNSMGIVNHAVGSVVTDAGAAADTPFTVGFVPKVIRWHNVTDRIMLEWYNGIGANSVRTVAAGTRTLDASSFIVVDLTQPNSGCVFTIKAADIPASKVCFWEAIG